MKIVEPAAKLLAYTQLPPHDPSLITDTDPCGDMARVVERCGRVSWKSEAKIERGSADDFMTRVVNIRKDESIAEHCSATILFIMDRYASHQLVRHRIGAYTQESTHYINYAKRNGELEFCRPLGLPQTVTVPCAFCSHLPEHIKALAEPHVCHENIFPNPHFEDWKRICEDAEKMYLEMCAAGVKHHTARFVLPGCLKTEVAVTYNLRIWRYVFGLRCTPNNTPEIVQSMKQGLQIMYKLCPPMFQDQYDQFLGDSK